MRTIIVFSVLVLAGCVAPAAPFISDIDEDHVRVHGLGKFTTFVIGRDPTPNDYDLSEFDAKAIEACAIYDKDPTPALSVRPAVDYNIEALYACK